MGKRSKTKLIIRSIILVSIPSLNNYSYSGKLFDRHYDEDEKYKEEKLKNYTKQNHLRVLRALIFGILLNGVLTYQSLIKL